MEGKDIKTLTERIRKHKRTTIVDNTKILRSQFILKKRGHGKKVLRKQGKKSKQTAARGGKKNKLKQKSE